MASRVTIPAQDTLNSLLISAWYEFKDRPIGDDSTGRITIRHEGQREKGKEFWLSWKIQHNRKIPIAVGAKFHKREESEKAGAAGQRAGIFPRSTLTTSVIQGLSPDFIESIEIQYAGEMGPKIRIGSFFWGRMTNIRTYNGTLENADELLAQIYSPRGSDAIVQPTSIKWDVLREMYETSLRTSNDLEIHRTQKKKRSWIKLFPKSDTYEYGFEFEKARKENELFTSLDKVNHKWKLYLPGKTSFRYNKRWVAEG